MNVETSLSLLVLENSVSSKHVWDANHLLYCQGSYEHEYDTNSLSMLTL
jgi:hypothetical protein